MDAFILLGSFLVLMLIGMPVAYALGLAAVIGALWIDIPLDALMIQIAAGVNKFSLLAIPFFVLAGAIMAEGGMARRLIVASEMFRGTLSQSSVYPREVVKEALRVNAASLIFSHNHPSGSTTPSRADEMLTNTLKSALALVDVRVLDHVIVAGNQTLSFAERGLL